MTLDTTIGIWEKKYMVKLPAIGGTSTSFLRHHGTYITGDKNIDRSLNRDWIATYLSIDQMLDYYRDGVSIAVVNPKDCKKIYEDIEAHLTAWVDQLQFGLNNYNAPLKDLVDLDNFAGVVYPHAKKHISEALINNALGRRMEDRFGFTPASFLKPTTPKPEVEMERTPYSDFLKSRLERR